MDPNLNSMNWNYNDKSIILLLSYSLMYYHYLFRFVTSCKIIAQRLVCNTHLILALCRMPLIIPLILYVAWFFKPVLVTALVNIHVNTAYRSIQFQFDWNSNKFNSARGLTLLRSKLLLWVPLFLISPSRAKLNITNLYIPNGSYFCHLASMK